MSEFRTVIEAAERLWHARIKAKACEPLAATFSVSAAYKASEINLKRRLQQGGTRLVGKKIGLTSRAVQKQLQMNEPDFGYLTSDMNLPMGGCVTMSGLIQPRVEGETAFVLKRDLRGPGITVADVIRATDFVLPCIEIIDSRVKDWKIRISDSIADNASSAAFVLGADPVLLHRLELRDAGMALRVNGEVVSSGSGAACLNHPCLAVAWLANKLGEFGEALFAGDVILSGAFGTVFPVSGGEHVEVAISGLGTVHCTFAEREAGKSAAEREAGKSAAEREA